MHTPSTSSRRPHLAILGIRGIPAAHGGFETFAERLALYLRDRGWRVTVYCQEDTQGKLFQDEWEGIERVRIPCGKETAASTIVFDWRAIAHAARHKPDVALTLGYNTAVFCALLRAAGVPNAINMDGIEWQRDKWSGPAKAWLWLNEWAGARLGNHLIADHPSIADHLAQRADPDKITVIPYGANEVLSAPTEPVTALGLTPGKFLTVIARPEIENSLLEIVQGFSAEPRGVTLAVLGRYAPDTHPYHRAVMAAASREVKFLGPVYDPKVVSALRFHSLMYVHGHRVGGTNPSLVEALAAGNPVLAHRNRFNRWVAGSDAAFFDGTEEAAAAFDMLLEQPARLAAMSRASRQRFQERFRWGPVLQRYEHLLWRYARRHPGWSPSMEPQDLRDSAVLGAGLTRSQLPRSMAE